jgi:hypothetical protein
MEDSIEVRYAGVIVGRTAAVRGLDGSGAFIGIAEPLPVGTIVTLKMSDGTKEARVAEVVESAEPNVVGMRVVFDLGARAFAPRAAAPAPVAASASAPVAAPASAPVAAPASAPVAAVVAEPVPAMAAMPVDESIDEGSAPLAAPLSLAGPDASGSPGGGKKRRKRR